MRRPWWLRLFQPVPRLSDNVNVQPFGPGFVAMSEAPRQATIDPQTLAVTGGLRYEDKLGSPASSAHPWLDIERGLMVNVAQVFGPKPECLLYQHLCLGGARERECRERRFRQLGLYASYARPSLATAMPIHPG